jgi:hypothetical protein
VAEGLGQGGGVRVGKLGLGHGHGYSFVFCLRRAPEGHPQRIGHCR